MKKYILKTALIVLTIISITGCQDENLQHANFLLDAVDDFAATAGHEMVTLTWEKPENENLEQYILSWTPNDSIVYLDVTETGYAIKNLKNETDYTFTIQGDYGNNGISGVSEISSAPVDELNFQAMAGNGFAVLVWDTPNRDDLAGYQISWSPGDNTISLDASKNTYTLQGLTNGEEYTFRFTCKYSGSSSETITKTITPGELNAFTISSGQIFAGEDVSFVFNPAYLPVSTATSWSWDFGDGSTSTEESPTHNFTTAGEYTIKLSFTDDKGETYEVESIIDIIGIIWQFTPSTHIKTSSPAIAADGTVYIGDVNGYLYALNPDGSQKWSFLCGNTGDQIYGSCPAIGSDGTVYVGSYSGNLYAVNTDGTQKWAFATGDKVFGSPAIASDGTIYIGSQDGNVYAVNSDGSQKWSYTTGNAVKSSPAVASDGTVYIGSQDGNLYAINADGTQKWIFATTGSGTVEGSPVIGSDGIIYFGDDANENSKFYALSSAGTEIWSYGLTAECVGSAVLGEDGTIYFGTKGSVFYALSPDGSLKWQFTDGGKYTYVSAAVASDGSIIVGSTDMNLNSLNPVDGTLNWSLTLGGQMFSSPVIASDGTIYIGTLSNPGFYAIYAGIDGAANSLWPMKRNDALQNGRIY